jgi:hypothetical protein
MIPRAARCFPIVKGGLGVARRRAYYARPPGSEGVIPLIVGFESESQNLTEDACVFRQQGPKHAATPMIRPVSAGGLSPFLIPGSHVPS